MMAASRYWVATLLLYLALFHDAVLPTREECVDVVELPIRRDYLAGMAAGSAAEFQRADVPDYQPGDGPGQDHGQSSGNPPPEARRGHASGRLLLAGCSAEIQLDSSPITVVDTADDALLSLQPPTKHSMQFPAFSNGDRTIIWLLTSLSVFKSVGKTLLCATIGSASTIDVLVQRSRNHTGLGRKLLDVPSCDLSTDINELTSCSLTSTSSIVVTRNALPVENNERGVFRASATLADVGSLQAPQVQLTITTVSQQCLLNLRRTW